MQKKTPQLLGGAGFSPESHVLKHRPAPRGSNHYHDNNINNAGYFIFNL